MKSVSDPGDGSIWDPHPSPYIRRIIELFTARGLKRIGALQLELAKWLDGSIARSGTLEPAPDTGSMLRRWSPGEMALMKRYLQAIPIDDLQDRDWLMLVDFLVQKYMPEGDIVAEANWLAYRASVMGSVQAHAGGVTETQADSILMAIPQTLPEAAAVFSISPPLLAAINYGQARCAENVVGLTDDLRHSLRSTVLDWQYAISTHDPLLKEALETRLFDKFATMNRDWRRIAITEAGENANQGMVIATGPGGQLRRLEHYKGACQFCRSIDGRVMTVVAPDDPDKDGDTQIWSGKTNVGRSGAPSKRTDNGLVLRTPDERLWVAAGSQHPNCRGTWAAVNKPERAGDTDFTNWLTDELAKVK
jgi:hypothetical protein